MSDCSINAMKPKEPSKTCGNCGHGDYLSTVYCDVFNCDMLVSDKPCQDWIKNENNQDQRYQQLGQVAKDMFKCIDESMDRETYVTTFGELGSWQDQLKELGVEIDD